MKNLTILTVEPGQGTIQKIRDKAEAEGKQFLDIRLDMCDVSDFTFNNVYGQLTSDWVKKANSTPTILVFDDYQRAMPTMKTLIDTIITENKIVLPYNTVENLFTDNVELYIINTTLDKNVDTELLNLEVSAFIEENPLYTNTVEDHMTRYRNGYDGLLDYSNKETSAAFKEVVQQILLHRIKEAVLAE